MMTKRFLLGCSMVCVAFVLFVGCGRQKKFAFAVPQEAPTVMSGVEVRIHHLSKSEKKKLFIKNSSYFAKKYEAIQIYIKNNNVRKYVLAGENVSFELESYEDIKHRLEKWNNNIFESLFFNFYQQRMHRKIAREEEQKAKTENRIICRDSVIKLPISLSYTGVLLVRKEKFTPNFSIKLVDSKNGSPLCFDLFVESYVDQSRAGKKRRRQPSYCVS